MRLWSSIKDNIFRFAFGPATVGVLRLLTRVRLIGRSNAMRFRGLTKHRGGIVVCNHTHYLDAAFAVWALWPRRLWFTSQAQNFSLPVAGRILSFWDVVGVVGGEGGKELFNAQLGVLLNEGKSVVIYPEGNLRPFEKELQPFHKGAFHVAITEQVPILPIVAVPETRKMWWGDRRRGMRVEVLPPVYPPPLPAKGEYVAAVTALRDQVFQMMSTRMAAAN